MDYDMLKLENQLCFPIYAAARDVVRRYTPYLDEIGLTYTQYICMMVLWEKKSLSVKELGEALYLDSGTLTPLLKRMEKDGLVSRARSEADERCVVVTITDKGEVLKERAKDIPAKIAGCINLPAEDAATLYSLLYRILQSG